MPKSWGTLVLCLALRGHPGVGKVYAVLAPLQSGTGMMLVVERRNHTRKSAVIDFNIWHRVWRSLNKLGTKYKFPILTLGWVSIWVELMFFARLPSPDWIWKLRSRGGPVVASPASLPPSFGLAAAVTDLQDLCWPDIKWFRSPDSGPLSYVWITAEQAVCLLWGGDSLGSCAVKVACLRDAVLLRSADAAIVLQQ